MKLTLPGVRLVTREQDGRQDRHTAAFVRELQ